MALKTHILARRWNEPGKTEQGITACGEPLFKTAQGGYVADEEWEAVRRIGGALAVPERQFYPDADACKKCQAKWEALEV